MQKLGLIAIYIFSETNANNLIFDRLELPGQMANWGIPLNDFFPYLNLEIFQFL